MFRCTNAYRLPEKQLALDEALLEHCEQSAGRVEWLRCWEVNEPIVVLGRSGRIHQEVHTDGCREDRVRWLRRGTGGGAVVLAPGCLVYSIVLSLPKRPALADISTAHHWIRQQLQTALRNCGVDAQPAGISDLTWKGKKCSGNSMKLKSHGLLYHGTLLYAAPLDLFTRYLSHPPREPDYRAGRAHGEFVVNVPIEPHRFREELQGVFAADQAEALPEELVERWMRDRYACSTWHETGRTSCQSPTAPQNPLGTQQARENQ